MNRREFVYFAIGLGVVAGIAMSIKVGKTVYDKTIITDAMFRDSAAKLGVDEAFLRAIAEKEGGGNGFYITGKPVVRMENHILDRYYASKGKTFNAAAKYGSNKVGAAEYDRFMKAYEDNPEAAIYSTSFGAFQIMGFNALPLGYPSYSDFYRKMSGSANDQFDAMIRFIQKNNLIQYIKSRDYSSFAKKYNGSVTYAQGSNGLAALHEKWIKKLA